MQITKQVMRNEFEKFVERIFCLPETYVVKAKGSVIGKADKKEEIRDKVAAIVDESFHDRYSDIDFHVGVRLSPYGKVDAERYSAMRERYGLYRGACLGIVFVPENYMYRIVMRNGMRYDMGLDIIMDEQAPVLDEEIFSGGQTRKVREELPLGAKVYIMGETRFGDGEGKNGTGEITREEMDADRFWFVQVQALGKLYRRDFLISDHLANMNLNETLVLQMQMRDIRYGTNHHRYGYSEKLEYLCYLEDLQRNPEKCLYHEENPVFNQIADKLFAAGAAYDALAKRQVMGYEERSGIFREIWEGYRGAATTEGML